MAEEIKIDLSKIRKDAVLIYSVGRTMLSAGAFTACQAAATIAMWPWMHTSAYWCQSLRLGFREAIAKGYKYAITCDGDTIFNWQHVAYLYAQAEVNTTADAIASFQVKRQSIQMLMNVADPEATTVKVLEDDLVPATLAHFGLTIFRLDSLKDVPQPWFLRLPDPKNPNESVDEDVYFWNQWIANNKTLLVATRCPVGHVEEFVTWPGKNYRPVHQHWGQYYQSQQMPPEAKEMAWEPVE